MTDIDKSAAADKSAAKPKIEVSQFFRNRIPKKYLKGYTNEQIRAGGAGPIGLLKKLPGGPIALVKECKQAKKAIKFHQRKAGTLQFVKRLRSLRKLHARNDLKREKRVFEEKAAKFSQIVEDRAKTMAEKQNREVKPMSEKEAKKKIVRLKYSAVSMRRVYETQMPVQSVNGDAIFNRKEKKRMNPPKLRKSLQPGTVCIVVSGRCQGKKVVFLKHMKKTGLCLVTGPSCVNKVYLRRLHQNFMIATSVRLDMKDVKIPTRIRDSYFKIKKTPKTSIKESPEALLAPKEKTKTLDSKFFADQKAIDKQLMAAINAREDKKILTRYLRSRFGLRKRRYIHNMTF